MNNKTGFFMNCRSAKPYGRTASGVFFSIMVWQHQIKQSISQTINQSIKEVKTSLKAKYCPRYHTHKKTHKTRVTLTYDIRPWYWV